MSGQAQDSLFDQLRRVRAAATQLGCFDAADWIQRFYFEAYSWQECPVRHPEKDLPCDRRKNHTGPHEHDTGGAIYRWPPASTLRTTEETP